MKEKLTYKKPEAKEVASQLPLFEKLLKDFAKKIEAEPDLKFLEDFYQQFPEANIYLTGGMVRDAAVGIKKMAKDFDFVINRIDPDQLVKFLKAKGKVVLLSKNFNVIKFTPQDPEAAEAMDIVLPHADFSIEGIGGFGNPDIKGDPNLSIEDDLSRRDFTFNAIAVDLKSKSIIDPFGGLSSLAKKEIKSVRNPEEGFKKDYSRMLRALRFAAYFDFKLEKSTWQALKNLATNINKERTNAHGKKERLVAPEVIAKEFLKACQANPLKTLELYEQSGLLKELMPELLELKGCEQPPEFHSEGDVWQHTLLALAHTQSEEFKDEFGEDKPPLEVLLAILLHDIAKPQTQGLDETKKRITFYGHEQASADLARQICNRLTLPSYDGLVNKDNLVWLIENHMLSKGENATSIKATTLEKKFFKNPQLGKELLMVCFADDLACLTPHGPNTAGYYILKEKIAALPKREEKIKLPPPLLDGHEIMKITGLAPGPAIGDLHLKLREAQLNKVVTNKEEAIEFIKKQLHKEE